jgi:hypothetical protein
MEINKKIRVVTFVINFQLEDNFIYFKINNRKKKSNILLEKINNLKQSFVC